MGRGGFEPPTHGFSVRCSKNANLDEAKTCETSKEQLTPQLILKSPKEGRIGTTELPQDLVEIIQFWPNLPEHIKAAIKALVQSHIQGVQK